MDSQLAPITNEGQTVVYVRSRFRAAFFSVGMRSFLEGAVAHSEGSTLVEAGKQRFLAF